MSCSAVAAERVVLQVANADKASVIAAVKKQGGVVKVNADGFLAVEYPAPVLSRSALRGQAGSMVHPKIKTMELDAPRYQQSLYQDDIGDAMRQQITPYAIYQSQVNQIPFYSSSAPKVCVIDSGLDRSNSDFNWGVISGDDDTGTGHWDEAGSNHGTHVAGTIGAADNGVGVVGMAPGVAMHIIKVFGPDGWAYSSDLAYAAQKCTAAGAKIISMSLGGGASNTAESDAFAKFTAAGGLVIAAAGNSGNNVRSYPAGYPSVMMVGANDADNQIADFSQYPSCTTSGATDENSCVEVTAGGVATFSTYPAGRATIAALSTEQGALATSAFDNQGSAYANGYFFGKGETLDANAAGKVCLIDRGNITFVEKVNNCQKSGGVAAVIINNEAGVLSGTLGSSNTTSIPAVGAALADRATLLASSRVQVEVKAGDYGYMSGTSMATPAVSGIAARVWSKFPQCTGSQIRAALKATAKDSGAVGKDDYFGYGIVQAKAAVDYLTRYGCQGDQGGVTETSGTTYNLKASRGGWLYQQVTVPVGATEFSVALAGGSGNADLYLKVGGTPTKLSYQCRSAGRTNSERRTMKNPTPGVWTIGVYATSSFSSVTQSWNYK